MNKTAIITGADGGMGKEITKAIAKAGYTTIMACLNTDHAEQKYTEILKETQGNVVLTHIDLASPQSIFGFVEKIAAEHPKIDLLINNAGVLYPKIKTLEGRWDYTTMVNYFGHFLLTNKLLPLFREKAKIINIISLTYRFGKIIPQMFDSGRDSWVQQVINYSSSKLALLYFSLDLAEQLAEKNISVNCSDPGIVGTKIIAMNNPIFDKVCDIFARPFMKSPKNGAKTAVFLALTENIGNCSGGYFKNEKQVPVLSRVMHSKERELLRELTHKLLHEKNICL